MRALSFFTLGLAALGLASPSPSHEGECDDTTSPSDGSYGEGSYGEGSYGGVDGGHGRGHCISRAEAQDLAKAYAALVGAFDEADAQHWLADDFVDYSDSINTFTNKPLGSATFDKASFIASQSSGTLPPTPIELIGEPVVDCDRVAILWSSTFGKGWVSRGLTIVDVAENEDKDDGRSKWLMARWDVEFNSLAWAYDMGQYFCLFGKAFGDPSMCGAPKMRRGLQ